MTQVITSKYHYSDDEEPKYSRPLKIGQKELPNGEWALWDNTNNVEVPWDKVSGICYSIDEYIKNRKK